MPRCLVAEQDEELLAGLMEELSAMGWEVVSARSADEAERLKGSTESFDILLIDEYWPAPGGIASEEWFRREEHLGGVPLVLMTASVPRAPTTHNGCLTIEKPFNARQLVHLLRHLVAGAG